MLFANLRVRVRPSTGGLIDTLVGEYRCLPTSHNAADVAQFRRRASSRPSWSGRDSRAGACFMDTREDFGDMTFDPPAGGVGEALKRMIDDRSRGEASERGGHGRGHSRPRDNGRYATHRSDVGRYPNQRADNFRERPSQQQARINSAGPRFQTFGRPGPSNESAESTEATTALNGTGKVKFKVERGMGPLGVDLAQDNEVQNYHGGWNDFGSDGRQSDRRREKWRDDRRQRLDRDRDNRTERDRRSATWSRQQTDSSDGSGGRAQQRRFQQFGRPGGGGDVAAAAIAETFGQGATVEKPKSFRMKADDFGEDVVKHDDWHSRVALIDWLADNVAVSDGTAVGMLEREGRIVQQSAEDMGKIVQWFSETLELNEDKTRTMLVRKPALLCRDLDKNLKPKVQWLKEELELDDKQAGVVVTQAPNILTSEVETMGAKIDWLSQRLGVTRAEIAEIVVGCPFALANGISTGLEPRLQWMHENLFRDEATMRDHILLHPSMIGHSLHSTLVPCFRLFKDTLGMDVAKVRATLIRNPRLFTTHLGENVVNKQAWLRQALGVTDPKDMMSILRTEPQLLIRSNDRLDAHVRFFQSQMTASIDDIREGVMTDPRLLLASLENLWVPRVYALKAAGITADFKTQWQGTLKYDDLEFQTRLLTYSPKAAIREEAQ